MRIEKFSAGKYNQEKHVINDTSNLLRWLKEHIDSDCELTEIRNFKSDVAVSITVDSRIVVFSDGTWIRYTDFTKVLDLLSHYNLDSVDEMELSYTMGIKDPWQTTSQEYYTIDVKLAVNSKTILFSDDEADEITHDMRIVDTIHKSWEAIAKKNAPGESSTMFSGVMGQALGQYHESKKGNN